MKFSDQLRTRWRNLTRQKLRTGLTVFANDLRFKGNYPAPSPPSRTRTPRTATT